MANHDSTKKSIRKIARRTAVNRASRGRVRTFIKKVEAAIEAANKTEAQEAFKTAESEIMRGVSKGILKLNTASRKVSRLSKSIKALADKKTAKK
ncbi:30S ribosomal protein S20 [Rickettsiales bacterium]|nr:30S ribosomal protein S20 [Rickettsiales bacterium]